jgi:hypothetical protein
MEKYLLGLFVLAIIFLSALRDTSDIGAARLKEKNRQVLTTAFKTQQQDVLEEITKIRRHDILLASEVVSCFEQSQRLYLGHADIVAEKMVMLDLAYVCLQYRYHWAVKNDASRYDVLSDAFREIGFTVAVDKNSVTDALRNQYLSAYR